MQFHRTNVKIEVNLLSQRGDRMTLQDDCGERERGGRKGRVRMMAENGQET